MGCSGNTRRSLPRNDARVSANKDQHRTLDVTPTRPWSLPLMVYRLTVTSQPSMLYSLLVYVICDVTCDVGGKNFFDWIKWDDMLVCMCNGYDHSKGSIIIRRRAHQLSRKTVPLSLILYHYANLHPHWIHTRANIPTDQVAKLSSPPFFVLKLWSLEKGNLRNTFVFTFGIPRPLIIG